MAMTETTQAKVEAIARLVAAEFDLKPAHLSGGRRFGKVALARLTAIYIARQVTWATAEDLAAHFSLKTASSATHAVKRVTDERDASPRFAARLARMTDSALAEACAIDDASRSQAANDTGARQ